MPTAYLKKLAKLNHTTVNKIEKFWAQAKEIAKSEGNGKAWGLITSIFQNKLKKEGYKVKAFKEETREVDDKEFIFKRLSLSDCVKQIKDLFDDYFNLGNKDSEYYEKLYKTEVDESTASDLLPSDDFTVYIEYNDGSKWYSVDNPKLKDLKLTGIKNCIIEYPAYTAYFGKDCRIERFDNAEDAPYVVKCEDKMNKYAYKGKVITASSREEAIQQIVADSKKPKIDMKVVNKWMKKNLDLTDEGLGKDHWKDDKTGEVYYTHRAARRLAKKVPGYHLPTAEEWNELAEACGGVYKHQEYWGGKPRKEDGLKDYIKCSELKNKLKIKLVGYYVDEFLYKLGSKTGFWTDTIYGRGAYSRYLGTGNSITSYGDDRDMGLSVRLVKD